METIAILGFVFGIFGLIALGQVNKLKIDVEKLKETVQEIVGKSD